MGYSSRDPNETQKSNGAWATRQVSTLTCSDLVIFLWGFSLPTNPSKPGKIHLQIVEVLKRFPEGVTGGTIRLELEKQGLRPEDQTHLDRRKRDLKKWFVIKKTKGTVEVDGKTRPVVLYQFVGERKGVLDEGGIGQRVRAEVIRAASGRCQTLPARSLVAT